MKNFSILSRLNIVKGADPEIGTRFGRVFDKPYGAQAHRSLSVGAENGDPAALGRIADALHSVRYQEALPDLGEYAGEHADEQHDDSMSGVSGDLSEQRRFMDEAREKLPAEFFDSPYTGTTLKDHARRGEDWAISKLSELSGVDQFDDIVDVERALRQVDPSHHEKTQEDFVREGGTSPQQSGADATQGAIQTGPRGGRYIEGPGGSKTYVDKSSGILDRLGIFKARRPVEAERFEMHSSHPSVAEGIRAGDPAAIGHALDHIRSQLKADVRSAYGLRGRELDEKTTQHFSRKIRESMHGDNAGSRKITQGLQEQLLRRLPESVKNQPFPGNRLEDAIRRNDPDAISHVMAAIGPVGAKYAPASGYSAGIKDREALLDFVGREAKGHAMLQGLWTTDETKRAKRIADRKKLDREEKKREKQQGMTGSPVTNTQSTESSGSESKQQQPQGAIQTGPRGGRYIEGPGGGKHYVDKSHDILDWLGISSH